MKRFVICAMLCVMAVSSAAAQEAAAAKTEPKTEPAAEAEATAEPEQRNFFVRFWRSFGNIFIEGLITPQVHKPFSVMVGIEGTQNDRESLLPLVYAAVDYEFSRYSSLGIRGGLTFGSKQPVYSLVSVMEGVIYGRLYLWDWGFIRPFIQTGFGISIGREQEYEYTDWLGEVTSGVRMHWKGWFIENNVRFGYPFVVGFGVNVGHSFLP